MTRQTPQQERSRALREAILNTAAEILQRDGLAGLNTGRIATGAGCSVGALYRYFANKDKVLQALTQRYGEHLLTVMGQALSTFVPGQDWHITVDAVFDAFVAFYRDEPGYQTLWIGAAWTPELLATSRGWSDAMLCPVTALLQNVQPALCELEARHVAQTTMGLLSNLVTQALELGEPLLLDEARLALHSYLDTRLA